jgi:hypothetical protein
MNCKLVHARVRSQGYGDSKGGSMTVKEIHQHDYTKGSVRYTIHVEETDSGVMWGTWNCHECNIGGSVSKGSNTVDDAVEAARSDLERHHTTNHEV